ncbi:hypothetical protein DFH09DRAFT_1276080 [Mycena vulgaris]|nr:hypothetical protein DFH09DRAFT_1276080 [Mycena vulgaris]
MAPRCHCFFGALDQNPHNFPFGLLALAALLVERSRSQLLDISFNLEISCCQNMVPLEHALETVIPHIGRWRKIAFRAGLHEIHEFCEFLATSPDAPSKLEAAHFLDVPVDDTSPDTPPTLSGLTRSESFHSFRADLWLNFHDLTSFRALHHLDIDYNVDYSQYAQILGPSSTLTSMVIRYLQVQDIPMLGRIDASTIRSLAIRSSENFGFTTMFSLPNLENLELMELCSGWADDIQVPADAPLFPRLRTLRLDGAAFSPTRLKFIQ